jgi:hypothetical protein
MDQNYSAPPPARCFILPLNTQALAVRAECMRPQNLLGEAAIVQREIQQ